MKNRRRSGLGLRDPMVLVFAMGILFGVVGGAYLAFEPGPEAQQQKDVAALSPAPSADELSCAAAYFSTRMAGHAFADPCVARYPRILEPGKQEQYATYSEAGLRACLALKVPGPCFAKLGFPEDISVDEVRTMIQPSEKILASSKQISLTLSNAAKVMLIVGLIMMLVAGLVMNGEPYPRES